MSDGIKWECDHEWGPWVDPIMEMALERGVGMVTASCHEHRDCVKCGEREHGQFVGFIGDLINYQAEKLAKFGRP